MKSVGIRFNEGGRTYTFDPGELELKIDQHVVVETARGFRYGTVVTKIQDLNETTLTLPLKKVLRIATKEDDAQYEKNCADEKQALVNARNFAENLNLPMHFIDASFTLDRNQLLMNYVASQRIDFRELVKKLAQVYRTRIELHQVGVRDKAKIVGGLGPCGRFLCCNSFLTDFDSVSINMAKNQYLSLNPTKINGVCGRLLCCLNYEDEEYSRMRKGLPDLGAIVETEEGSGKVIDVDVLHRTYRVDLKAKGVVTVTADEQ